MFLHLMSPIIFSIENFKLNPKMKIFSDSTRIGGLLTVCHISTKKDILFLPPLTKQYEYEEIENRKQVIFPLVISNIILDRIHFTSNTVYDLYEKKNLFSIFQRNNQLVFCFLVMTSSSQIE